MPPAYVSIVSNSRLLCEGLPLLLATRIDLRVACIYPGMFPPATSLPGLLGHVVLLDGGMGQTTVVRWTRYLRSLTPSAQVVVFELADTIELIMACIEAGVAAYTLQGATADDIAAAIRRISRTEPVCSPAGTEQLLARMAASLAPPLTAREIEVLRYIAADYSDKEIAAALVIALPTVKHHVHNILEKLRLHHRWDAAQQALEHGWIPAESWQALERP